MQLKAELKSKFEGMTPEEINNGAKKLKRDTMSAMISFVEHLSYLKVTGLYRKIDKYQFSTFDAFVRAEHGINHFYNIEWAALSHPQESLEFGLHVIADIKRKAKAERANKIIGKLNKEKDKKGDLSFPEIERIIEKNIPTKEKPSLPPPPMELQSTIDKLRADLLARDELIKELHDQNDKLKKTVNLLKDHLESELKKILE